MITADHKVLNEDQESRLHHKCAVIVQDMATPWIQSYPCKTKSAQETQRSLRPFFRPEENPQNLFVNNSLEFLEACEELNWNHQWSALHRCETNGIAERAVTSQYWFV